MGNVLANLLKARAADEAADIQREMAGTVPSLEPAAVAARSDDAREFDVETHRQQLDAISRLLTDGDVDAARQVAEEGPWTSEDHARAAAAH